MQNKRVLTVSLVGLLLVTAVILAQETKTVSSGKDVYTKKCASCHGKLGEGVPKMATMLKTTIHDFRKISVNADTLAAWKKVTSEGRKKMPAFKTKLSAAEIDSALAYTVCLAKAGQPDKTGTGSDSAKGDQK
jgi:mono/diheme cytochrome c family protein